jgi:hypothetical protein
MSAFRTAVGTPSHLVENEHNRGGDAKGALMRVLRKHRKWADRFNHALRDQCDGTLVEISSLNAYALPLRQPRRWELRDEHSGVTLVLEMERLT